MPKDNRSILRKLADLPKEEREAWIKDIIEKRYPDKGYEGIKYDWELHARPSQLIPFDITNQWNVFNFCAGRGYGKSRALNEWVIHMAKTQPYIRICMIAPTAGDIDKVMLKGDSGILSISPPWFYPIYNPTYHRITWPNGSVAEAFSAERPDRLRGPQFHVCAQEEVTSWRFLQETYEMMEYGLRLGSDNRIVIATTPKNIEFYVNILKDRKNWTYVSNTFENQDNLSKTYLQKMIDKYAGTRMGQQELEAEILADDDKALWKREWIDKNRVKIRLDDYGNPVPQDEILPDFISIVLAIDPAVSINKKSAETAISVAAYGVDGKYYILYADSAKDTPDGWGRRVYELYDEYMCDSIVIETNQGGNLVVENLKRSGRQAPIVEVRARRGKLLRAEPIAALYERNQVRHFGKFEKCETQMCNFNQHFNKGLCDIVDSTVYALQALVDKVEGYTQNSVLYAVGEPRQTLMDFRVI
jgi:predicted phage terminase large subunit-like protein